MIFASGQWFRPMLGALECCSACSGYSFIGLMYPSEAVIRNFEGGSVKWTVWRLWRARGGGLIDMSFLCYHWCTQGSKGHALRKMGMCGDKWKGFGGFHYVSYVCSCLCRWF